MNTRSSSSRLANAPPDAALIGFVQHMLATARTEAAQQLFRQYLAVEWKRARGPGEWPAAARP